MVSSINTVSQVAIVKFQSSHLSFGTLKNRSKMVNDYRNALEFVYLKNQRIRCFTLIMFLYNSRYPLRVGVTFTLYSYPITTIIRTYLILLFRQGLVTVGPPLFDLGSSQELEETCAIPATSVKCLNNVIWDVTNGNRFR